MALQYYARTKISFGLGGGEKKIFEVGDLVEGLSKEDMVQLWEAGALSEVDPNARTKDDRDARIEELEEELRQLKAKQAEEDTEPETGDVPEDLVPDDDKKVETETSETKPAPAATTAAPAKAAPAKATEAKGDSA